ncbi:MAG: glycosyltransferase [Chloroflexi bacterium]|jgi:D-inositol-3-phosphate glycosyltransferase|nr:glycosyltransferase [Chloroflexota bacterium]MBT4003369.1 glycosyltransferase [Chloroflexota bacterium]MBT4305936.1 glycosyltransferase [Chloroflexota bacterium]MBT4533761.1 glycosyltransferase [Chloroflexota bacterium]MBT4681595.1 glycosyltransferase [Chloroflexota bacterium]
MVAKFRAKLYQHTYEIQKREIRKNGNNMRIAMISYHTCPLATLGGKDTGGMNVYVKEITQKLGSLGINVDIFTRSQDEHVPHVVHELGYGNRVVHIPAGPEFPIHKSELQDYVSVFAKNIIDFATKKNLKYDVIHSHYWLSGLAAADLKEEWGIPVVHMFHTLGLMKNRIAGNGEFEGEYRVIGERKVLKIADKIIAATTAELSQLQWLYEVPTNHIDIVPPGVNLRRFYPIPIDEAKEFIEIPETKKMILFVGRIEPLKGIDTIIKAFSILKESDYFEDHDICLTIIGGDASVSEDKMTTEMLKLKNLCAELELNNYVYFIGKQDQNALPYYYSAAAVVVMPSHYESFGMVAIEAMACATPVIASQVGGLAYLVIDGKNGFHVNNNSPLELSNKITSLIDDPELLNKMKIVALEHAKQYEWVEIAKQVIEIYNSVTK